MNEECKISILLKMSKNCSWRHDENEEEMEAKQ